MIFESLWPLFFLAAIPVIIILYLLKPRGTDYLISSNLLWKKLFSNEQSKTFFEKFVHNILMYVQILIVVLLTIALMSPFFKVDGQSGGRTILLLDTSASMQHKTSHGSTRFEDAIDKAVDYVKNSENRKFSLIVCSDCGTELLAVDSTDKDGTVALLRSLTPKDCGGNLASAQNLLDQVADANQDEEAGLIICTDGQGIDSYEAFHGFTKKELWLFGESADNVSNDYLSFSTKEDGTYDFICSITNHSDSKVTLDVTLKSEDGTLLSIKQMTVGGNENAVCLFDNITWENDTCSAVLSGFSFDNKEKDSLDADNTSYAIKHTSTQTNALLVGNGNTYLEKAYRAVSGSTISKSDSPSEGDEYRFQIFDAGFSPKETIGNVLVFGAQEHSVETINNVVLSVEDCDLTANLSGFQIGVNKTAVFDVPEWAQSFLEYNEKCVAYYGTHDGIREVVLGFDIRESDFPLRAEFPIFLANTISYLSDSSWLSSNICYSGEKVLLQPWAKIDKEQAQLSTDKVGLFQIGNEEYKEYYTVRFQTDTESDGHMNGDSIILEDTGHIQKVRKTLRNVFLALAIFLLLVEWILYVRQLRYKGKFYLAIRGLVLLMLTLALLGVQISKSSSKTATIFVVDISNSNQSHREEISHYLMSTIQKMPSRNQYGIVTFGQNALVEQFLTKDSVFAGLMSVPETGATCFEDALSRALAMIPGDYIGRIVLLTDGKQTKGDINNLSYAITNSNVELLTILYDSEVTQDAYIENVTLPTYLHPGDTYSVTIQVESNYETDANLLLYHGSTLSASNSVHLNKGANRFVIQQQVTDDTMESLHVKLEAVGDTCVENDSFNAYSVVEAPPKTLVISGRNSGISAFSAVLDAAGCDYSTMSCINAPNTIEEMLDYRCIILSDAYIDELPKGFLENIESYVKDYGCGFICCGGENSYALGGYRDSVLETILPVDMLLRSTNQLPSMAMVMIIDRSGSMSSAMDGGNGPTNLDVAIRSTTVAVDNLRDDDYVGVLTFDDGFDWQVPITKNTDRETIKKSIESINEGGGTTIKPAVKEAIAKLSDCDASIKHVVLLSDGMGETTDFRDVIATCTDSGITLSTVAIGDGSDTALLESLAKACNGRYYYSTLSTDLPRIFAQEVYLGADSYIQNGDISVSVRTNHDFAKNLFTEGWPNLNGYIAATPKPASTGVIVSTEKEDPILTVWQYGLGRTIAWNSDVSGEWSGPYSGQTDYVQLWKRVIDYSAGNGNLGDDSVNIVNIGDSTEITYNTGDYKNKTEIIANVIHPDGTTEEIKLHATAPGKYQASISSTQKGLYHFNVRKENDGQISNYITTASAVQFSDEYKFNVSTKAYLNFIEKYGKVITPSDSVWTKIKAKNREKYPLTEWLLGIGLLLFLMDVALRRFQIAPKPLKILLPKPAAKADSAETIHTEQTAQPMENTVETNEKAEKPKKVKKPKKEKKKQEEDTGLDTSLLLKKKDDRNL